MNLFSIVVILGVLVISAIAWAGKADLPTDAKDIRVQGHAPDARKTMSLTLEWQ